MCTKNKEYLLQVGNNAWESLLFLQNELQLIKECLVLELAGQLSVLNTSVQQNTSLYRVINRQ